MARARGAKRYLSSIKGLNTEASPLAFPEEYTVDEVNFTVDSTGGRRVRRAGLKQEGTTLVGSGELDLTDKAVITFEWKNVAGDEDISFLVTQSGGFLTFLDIAVVDPAANQKNFSFDLTDYQSAAATTAQLKGERVQFANAKGDLIVVSRYINTFRIIYDPSTDTISSETVDLKIRDLVGIDDSLRTDERPSVLSESHEYNLYNQGWYAEKRIHGGTAAYVEPEIQFKNDTTLYPSNADIVYLGTKDDTSGDGRFDSNTLRDKSLGNSPAPKGHFIFDAFNIDREAKRLAKDNSGGDAGTGTIFPSGLPPVVIF